MEKNYYELLGVSKEASTEEICDAFMKLSKEKYPDGFGETDQAKKEEFGFVYDAFKTLTDEETRAEYDKTLEKSVVKNLKVNENAKERLKNENVKLVAMLTTGVLVATFLGNLFGNAVSNWFGNKNSNNSEVNNSTSVVSEVDNTEPIVDEKLLTAENFEEKVQEILTDNQSKGLNIDPTFIRSALFITNIDYLDQEDIKKLYGNTDLNMIEEIQNMYNYTSAVGTHNNNVALGQEEGQYIALSDLAYDEQDKLILRELDQEFVDLVNDLKNQNMTDEQFQASFKYITEFYTGKSPLVTDGVEYDNYSLTSGAGLLSEQYWPMFSVNYASSKFITKENMIDIKTLSEGTEEQPAVINGSKYLGAIINHESLACLEEEKTLTKTQ